MLRIILALLVVGNGVGKMLQCGEDIVVYRGERKTLKFWSADDDLLKVQVVPAEGSQHRHPPNERRPITYNRIPGLSEAILAHSLHSDRYDNDIQETPSSGLHYAGNPNIVPDKIFRYENTTEDVEKEYYVEYAEPNDVSIVESLEKEDNKHQYLTTIASSTSTSSPITTSAASTTKLFTPTVSFSTTESIKLVTFFPNLQNDKSSTEKSNSTNDLIENVSPNSITNNDAITSTFTNDIKISEKEDIRNNDLGSHENDLADIFFRPNLGLGATLMESINKIILNEEKTSNTLADFLYDQTNGVTDSIDVTNPQKIDLVTESYIGTTNELTTSDNGQTDVIPTIPTDVSPQTDNSGYIVNKTISQKQQKVKNHEMSKSSEKSNSTEDLEHADILDTAAPNQLDTNVPPRGTENRVNEDVIQTTIIDDDYLLRSTIKNIVKEQKIFNKFEANHISQSTPESKENTVVVDDITTEVGVTPGTTIGNFAIESDGQTVSDSVEQIEVIMNEFDGGIVSSSEKNIMSEGLPSENRHSAEAYQNIKTVHMAGHQKISNSDNNEIADNKLDHSNVEIDYNATKASIPKVDIFSQSSNIGHVNDLTQQRVKIVIPDEIENLIVTTVPLINLQDYEDTTISLSKTANDEINETLQENLQNNILEEVDISTNESSLDETEDSNDSPTTEFYSTEKIDDFKGYDYYEQLYDSLMPQDQHKPSSISLDNIINGQSRKDLAIEETDAGTTFEDFETVQESTPIHYETTKDSIPIDNGNVLIESDNIDDITQNRVTAIQSKPVDLEEKDDTTIDVEKIELNRNSTADYTNIEDIEKTVSSIDINNDISVTESGDIIPDEVSSATEKYVSSNAPDYDLTQETISVPADDGLTAPDYDITKGSSPFFRNEILNPIDISSNIYLDENIKGVNERVQNNNFNIRIDTDTGITADVGNEDSKSEHDLMKNNILNSISSIIRNTLSSTEYKTNASTITILNETTPSTSLSEESMLEVTTTNSNELNNTTDIYSTDDLIQIPLIIVDGNVKVSQNRDSASIAVPISALESEETLNDYLTSQLATGSHVLIKRNGNLVPVNSLSELTEEINKDNIEIEQKKNVNVTDTVTNSDILTTPSKESDDLLPDDMMEVKNEETNISLNGEISSTKNNSGFQKENDSVDHVADNNTKESGLTTITSLEINTERILLKSESLSDEEKNLGTDDIHVIQSVDEEIQKYAPDDINTIRNDDSSVANSSPNNVIKILNEIILNEARTKEKVASKTNYNKLTEQDIDVTEERKTSHTFEDIKVNSNNDLSSTNRNNEEKAIIKERKPSRKDDSGHEFGGEPPFFIKLPGSPDAIPLYIQYEPVQVKYVSVENREGEIPLSEDKQKKNPDRFASRTGLEQEIDAIKTNLLLNDTMQILDTSDNPSTSSEKTSDVLSGIYQMIGNSSALIDNEIIDDDTLKLAGKSPASKSSHAHIPIPISFIPQHLSHQNEPDPFVVMESPDLTSQEILTPEEPSFDLYAHSKQPHLDIKHVSSSFTVSNEADNAILGEKYDGSDKSDVMPPGVYYSSEHRGTIYGDVDLDRLTNPVFKLQTKMRRPTADELMNPAYTPFPITTNPPRSTKTTTANLTSAGTESTSSGEIIRSTTDEIFSTTKLSNTVSEEGMLHNEIFGADVLERMETTEPSSASYRESQSVEYSPIPAIDFRLSYKPNNIPKFLKDNKKAFLSWYPQSDNDENSFRAAALTSSDLSQTVHGGVAVDNNNNSEDFNGFYLDGESKQRPRYTEKASARYTGISDPKETTWKTSDGQSYGAFYHPSDIPGIMLSDVTKRHLSLSKPNSGDLPWYTKQGKENQLNSEMPSSEFKDNPSASLLFGPKFFQYLNNLPAPLLQDFLEPSPSERAVRIKRQQPALGEHIFCEWNIKTEPGLYLLMNFQNLSAPYSVDCHGAYIEVERENNGYDARWCGNRVAHMGARPHVIFAKSEVRITVYDDGNSGKSQPTGFEADIDVIDLFNPREYTAFMETNAYPQIRRLLNG